MITYNIKVEGLATGKNISNIGKFRAYVQKAMVAIGATGVRNITHRIMQQDWKNSPRRLQRSIRFEAGDWSVKIFADPDIAPHAVYQEYGVEEHTMRYLTSATRPIPIRIGTALIYRWATERLMGVPHRIQDPQSGLIMQATGWVHPGYEGKYFFRDGVKDTAEEATTRLRALVIKVVRGES